MATEEKRSVGRPSLLTEELIQKALYYLASNGWKEAEDLVPSIAGLACYLGLDRSTIYAYKEQSEEFSYIVEGIAVAQEKLLINGGLGGAFNASITKLMMAKHGYAENSNLNVNSKVETTLPSLSGLFGKKS